jgi:hypothetical protein
LLGEAARYLEALDRADDPFDLFAGEETEADGDEAATGADEKPAVRRRKKSLSETEKLA